MGPGKVGEVGRPGARGSRLVTLLVSELAPGPARPERLLYSIAETAELLSLSYREVYRLAQRGELDTVRGGRRRLVPAEGVA